MGCVGLLKTVELLSGQLYALVWRIAHWYGRVWYSTEKLKNWSTNFIARCQVISSPSLCISAYAYLRPLEHTSKGRKEALLLRAHQRQKCTSRGNNTIARRAPFLAV